MDFVAAEQASHDAVALRDPSDEAGLWRRWRSEGDLEARASLLELHLPYARAVAAAYYGKRFNDEVEFDEYLQLARVGLLESMDRYEPSTAVQFRSFAAWRMHGAILDGLERSTEKQQQIAARRRLNAQRAHAVKEAIDKPVEGRGASATRDRALRYVAEAGLAFALAWVLDGTGMIEGAELPHNLPFYRSVELRQLRQRLLDAVDALPAQERTVIHGHYLQEIPFESIASRLGLTRGRISQVHKAALRRLRDALRAGPACDFLA